MADRSCFHPGLVRARAVLCCPEETRVGEAIMTKEAEAFYTTHSNQRGWSNAVFHLIRRRWWSIARIVRRESNDENATYYARDRRATQPHRRGAEGDRRGKIRLRVPGRGRDLCLPRPEHDRQRSRRVDRRERGASASRRHRRALARERPTARAAGRCRTGGVPIGYGRLSRSVRRRRRGRDVGDRAARREPGRRALRGAAARCGPAC